MEVVKKLQEKKGEGMFTPVLSVMIWLFVFLALLEFIHLYSMMLNIRDYISEAVVQTATSNSYNAYNGVREGNSTAHIYAGSGVWNEMVSTAELMNTLESTLGADRQGNTLTKTNDSGKFLYGIKDINIFCSNVTVGTNGNSVKLTFKTTVTAQIPIRFLGIEIISEHQISLKSYYTPRF